MFKKTGKFLDWFMMAMTPLLGVWATVELWSVSMGLAVSCIGWVLLATGWWYKEAKK